MKKTRGLWIALYVGAAAALLAACGDEANGPLEECVTDEDCASGELCLAGAGRCVQTCDSAADCPDSAKRCEPVGGTGPQASTRICKCQTDELCALGDLGPTAVCSEVFDICVQRCEGDGDCPAGFVCDLDTGGCFAGSGESCTWGSCGPGLNCDLSSGVCESAQACTPTEPAPGACSYGQFCTAAGQCDFVPRPQCPNITNAGIDWNPATATGPVIYEVEQEFFGLDTGFCPTAGVNKRARIRVSAYRPLGAFTSQQDVLDALNYYQVDGTLGADPGLQNLQLGNNGRSATFDLNFCVPNDFGQLTVGLHFTGGNGYCFVVE